MTPRLAVTQEQAEQFYVVDRGQASRSWRLRSGPVTLRLLERPTMPCSDLGMFCPMCNGTAYRPIPEGTRVRIEYPCDCAEHRPGMHVNTAKCPHRRTGGMISVAFATLSEIKSTDTDYLITLTDIEPV